ncbi:MAG: helix-turn-helix domain-containing protein [Actinobacteria bacterium]|nr:helix-turn-helix domain-containing protein [Actinomycetota bacterium]
MIIGRGPIYTVEEVSDLLGIPRPTLYRYLREYSIPHLRRSGRISIPEESFERIREARDLHKEGLGTASVRRLLREGGNPNSGELKERLDQLSENLERLRDNERPAAEEALPSYALRTMLARQNLLISAMFDLTEMVEELLLASGKPRKAVFDDVEGEIREVAPLPETPEGVPAATEASLKPSRPARFGSLSRRRRRGLLAILSALLAGLLLTWALPTLGSQLTSGFPFSIEVAAIKTVKSRKEAGTVMRTKPSAAAPGEPVVLVASGGPTGIPPGLRSGGARGAATAQYAN